MLSAEHLKDEAIEKAQPPMEKNVQLWRWLHKPHIFSFHSWFWLACVLLFFVHWLFIIIFLSRIFLCKTFFLHFFPTFWLWDFLLYRLFTLLFISLKTLQPHFALFSMSMFLFCFISTQTLYDYRGMFVNLAAFQLVLLLRLLLLLIVNLSRILFPNGWERKERKWLTQKTK